MIAWVYNFFKKVSFKDDCSYSFNRKLISMIGILQAVSMPKAIRIKAVAND